MQNKQKHIILSLYIKLTLIGCFVSSSICSQQIWELGSGLGLTNYQGELTSFNFDNGVQIKFDLAIALHAKYYLNNTFNTSINLMYTGAQGDDALSSSESTNRRNLSFQSPIMQASFRFEWNALGFEPGDMAQRFSPFATIGAGLFRFNPRARFENAWIPLQPLGTEGQGSAVFPGINKYKRVAFNIPMGGGIKWNITEQLTLTMDLIFHFSFTDYLDDVSTVYVTYPVLLEQRGELAATLANRTGELTGIGPVTVPTGTTRGNPEVDDHFLTGLVSIGYRIDPLKRRRISQKNVKCPKF